MKGACSMCLNQESPWSFCALPAGVCLEESKVWCLLPLQRNSILQVPREHNIPWLSHCSFFWLRFCNCCREQVANYIDRRDGSAVPKADPEDKCHAIWLFDAVGACRRVGRIERISTCLWKEPVSRISTWLMVHRLEWRRCLRLGSLPTSIAKSAWARAAWKHVQCTLTWSDLMWPDLTFKPGHDWWLAWWSPHPNPSIPTLFCVGLKPVLLLFRPIGVCACDAANEAAITRLGGTYIGYELMEDYTSGKGRQSNISIAGMIAWPALCVSDRMGHRCWRDWEEDSGVRLHLQVWFCQHYSCSDWSSLVIAGLHC